MSTGSISLAMRVEEVSLNSWPALEQVLYDGWILRFSGGYTRRANSINPLYDSSLDLEVKIDACEQLYADRGLPTIFRLNPFSKPGDLDRSLASRGYECQAPTLVMALDLDTTSLLPPTVGEMREVPLDEWLPYFSRLSGAPVERHQLHRQILEAIPARCAWAVLVDSEQVVACALGVLDSGFLGLFDLVTEPGQRTKGYGTSLVTALLRWARGADAQHAYLQVMDVNEPARRLYTMLGFRPLYPYWYRVPAPGS